MQILVSAKGNQVQQSPAFHVPPHHYRKKKSMTEFASVSNLSGSTLRSSCSTCSMKALCIPNGLNMGDTEKFDNVIARRKKIAKGDRLFKVADPFHSLYAIRMGHFKTSQTNAAGDEQITGFQMSGDILGMNAIGTNVHNCDSVALDDAEVCEVPFDLLQNLFGEVPLLLRHFHRMMGHEIAREQNVMLLLGNMKAEQRFAIFLAGLSARYAARGYSAKDFYLRMSREDIGNYLGLTIESVSRLISRFKKMDLISVDKRYIELLDVESIRDTAAGKTRSVSLQ